MAFDDAVRGLVRSGTLTDDEVAVLLPLPCKSRCVIGWLAAFWEQALSKDSGLPCSQRYGRQADNGRYSTVFGQLASAREAITVCHTYMETQLPYGYIHLILLIVQLTCLANTIFCGIHLGETVRTVIDSIDDPTQITTLTQSALILAPLTFVRLIRIVFVPLLLDGMLLIGTVIAMPLGDDEDDFPAGSFVERMEDECMATAVAIESFDAGKALAAKPVAVGQDGDAHPVKKFTL